MRMAVVQQVQNVCANHVDGFGTIGQRHTHAAFFKHGKPTPCTAHHPD